MKRNVWIFGLILGALLTGMMLYTTSLCYNDPKFESNEVLGYAALIAAFSFIFVAIKNYRDKYNNGMISFGQAFRTGFYVSFIASTMYVVVWLVAYYIFIPDFLDRYTEHCLYEASLDGATQAELDATAKEMAELKESYKNPAFFILTGYAEVLPLGIIVSLISALILKRKSKDGKPAIA